MRKVIAALGAALALLALAVPGEAVERIVLMEMMTNTS